MTRIIGEHLLKCNIFSSQTTNGSYHPTNSSDSLSQFYNSLIRKNIEAFYSQFTKQEIEVFKYLMWYWNKFGNIQIPILNLCNRFKLQARRIHYLLEKLNTTGIMEILKKGHTGKATKRAVTERGLILWKAISKGFGVVKNVINRTSADSCADSPRVHTNYISTKVDILKPNPPMEVQKKQENEPQKLCDSVSFFKNMRELLSN